MKVLVILARGLVCASMLTAVVIMTQSDTSAFVYGGF